MKTQSKHTPVPKHQCPWCEEHIEPIQNDGSGESQFGFKRDAHWIANNPAMCPKCNGVGGWEDFTLMTIARAEGRE